MKKGQLSIVNPLAAVLVSGLLVMGCSGSGGETDSSTLSTLNETVSEYNIDDGSGAAAAQRRFFNLNEGSDYAASLGHNMSFVFDAAFEPVMSALVLHQALSLLQTTPLLSGAGTEDTNCDSGHFLTSFDSVTLNAEVEFLDCITDSRTISGKVSLMGASSSGSSAVSVTFDNVVVTDNERNNAVNGSFLIQIASIDNERVNGSISGNQLTLQSNGEITVFSNFSLSVGVDPDSGKNSIAASAIISSSNDEDMVNVSIYPAFQLNEDEDYPETGTMLMTHSDGSSLQIEADTGDTNTYYYIINEDGAIISGTANWADSSSTGDVNRSWI